MLDAIGRVLATDIHAGSSSPPYSNSAVDGYAVNSRASKKSGVISLAILPGRAAAGHPYSGEVKEGEALPIYTGAKMPTGADTVVIKEDTVSEDIRLIFMAQLRLDRILVIWERMLRKMHLYSKKGKGLHQVILL